MQIAQPNISLNFVDDMPPAETPSFSALQRVITTPELLTLIISKLPPSTVLLSVQLVSKSWRAILQMPIIQQMILFNSPIAPSKMSPNHPVFSSLLISSFPPWFIDLQNRRRTTSLRYVSRESKLISLPWALNPDIWNRKDATWRGMLVVQPACRFLEIVQVVHARGGDRLKSDTIHCIDGLTMGTLYDVTERWCRGSVTDFDVKYDSGWKAESVSNLTAWDSRKQQIIHGFDLEHWQKEHSSPVYASNLEKGRLILTLHKTFVCTRPRDRDQNDAWSSKGGTSALFDYVKNRK